MSRISDCAQFSGSACKMKKEKIFTSPFVQRPHLNPLPAGEETNSSRASSFFPLSRWERRTRSASEGKRGAMGETDIGHACLGNQGREAVRESASEGISITITITIRSTSMSKSKKGKVYLLGFALAFLIGLAGCESTVFAPPPPVTAQMAARKGKHVNVATLEAGRTLFVHRCIECHTLPRVLALSSEGLARTRRFHGPSRAAKIRRTRRDPRLHHGRSRTVNPLPDFAYRARS